MEKLEQKKIMKTKLRSFHSNFLVNFHFICLSCKLFDGNFTVTFSKSQKQRIYEEYIYGLCK